MDHHPSVGKINSKIAPFTPCASLQCFLRNVFKTHAESFGLALKGAFNIFGQSFRYRDNLSMSMTTSGIDKSHFKGNSYAIIRYI